MCHLISVTIGPENQNIIIKYTIHARRSRWTEREILCPIEIDIGGHSFAYDYGGAVRRACVRATHLICTDCGLPSRLWAHKVIKTDLVAFDELILMRARFKEILHIYKWLNLNALHFHNTTTAQCLITFICHICHIYMRSLDLIKESFYPMQRISHLKCRNRFDGTGTRIEFFYAILS